jgi:hypothetical protein
LFAISFSSTLWADPKTSRCQAKLHTLTGGYLDCLLKAESKPTNSPAAEQARIRCEKTYNRQYDQIVKRGGDECLGSDARSSDIKPLLNSEVTDTVSEVTALITGSPPSPQAATLTVFNGCATPIKIMSPTSSTIDGMVLGPSESYSWPTSGGGGLNQNAPNTFMVAPVTTASQCTQIACQNWSDIQAPGQRMGYMWGNNPPHHNNLLYAAYCQPTNAAAKQCNSTSQTPCCGTSMVYDKTYGTTFEITPNGGSGLNQDFVDISTNYGSGPESPPPLCSSSTNPDDCVSATANIFFNVPVQVQMAPPGSPTPTCAFPPGATNTLSCTSVSCSDAYQYPTDAKQAVCPQSTGYVVTLCPSGSPLPTIPATASPEPSITINNHLSASNPPCPNGNTVSVFTSSGQTVIPAGDGSKTITGNFTTYPGLGLQVNNWYWTSVHLPVGLSPQNPDDSGAQFMLSDQCSLATAPPAYGKGIETYKIAKVTAQKPHPDARSISIPVPRIRMRSHPIVARHLFPVLRMCVPRAPGDRPTTSNRGHRSKQPFMGP